MANKPTGLNQVAVAISSALAGIDTSGICETICDALGAQFAGAPVPKEDGDNICAEVSRLRKWSPKAAEARKSELRSIFAAYVDLPSALEKVRESKSNAKAITFDAGVKLARSLKAGKTATQAVAAFIAGKGAGKVDPADRNLEQSLKSCATHVQRILDHKKLPAKFRSALAALCVEHDIAL